MAEPASAPKPQPDLSTVVSTLRFLHRTRRVHQFILKGSVAKRKQHEAVEAEARRQIKGLTLRMQRELDTYPELAQGMQGEDWTD